MTTPFQFQGEGTAANPYLIPWPQWVAIVDLLIKKWAITARSQVEAQRMAFEADTEMCERWPQLKGRRCTAIIQIPDDVKEERRKYIESYRSSHGDGRAFVARIENSQC